MAENLNLKTIDTVDTRPFKKLVMTIGELPTSFVESMTYYELLAWFVNYLETVIIPTVNNNAEAVQELQDLVVQLKKFVDEYFDNLDVQEEINNKLDEMVEDGTLTDIIDEYFADRVRYISGKFESGTLSNDSHLILTSKHSILIDCGLADYLNALIARLIRYNVTHIDYLIISHYDLDHFGGLSGLISGGYIDSNTTVYLPYVPSRFITKISDETYVKNLLDENNIPYRTPDNLETVQIDSLDVTFGNLDINYSEANYDIYNYTSMVVKIKHHDVLSFWAGDAGKPTYDFLYRTGFINTHVDLYKIGHHGIDYASLSPFTTVISPDYVIQPFDMLDYVKNNSHNQELAYLQNNGSKIIAVCDQSNYIEFESSFNAMACVNGATRSMSACHCNMTLYVDINASKTHIQDGTSDYPFTTLMQAISYTKNFPEGTVTIYVADGDYHAINGNQRTQKHKLEICNSKVKYHIIGNAKESVIISPIKLTNNSILRIENVTIMADSTVGDTAGVEVWDSDAIMYRCNITTADEESYDYGIVAYDGSTIYCDNVSIEKYGIGVRINRGSSASYGNISITNVTTAYSVAHGYMEPVSLMQSFDGETHTATTKQPLTYFDYVEVEYDTGAGGHCYGVAHMRTTTNSRGSMFSTLASAGGSLYNRQASPVVTDSTHIKIEYERQLTFSATPDNPTSSDITGSFSITKILGYKYSL